MGTVKDKHISNNTRSGNAWRVGEELLEIEIPKLLCVLDGCTDLRTGEYRLTCNAGHFVLVPPHLPLEYRRKSRKNGAFEKLMIR